MTRMTGDQQSTASPPQGLAKRKGLLIGLALGGAALAVFLLVVALPALSMRGGMDAPPGWDEFDDPLTQVEMSGIAPDHQAVCEQAMQEQSLPSSVGLVGTGQSSFSAVEAAMVERYGESAASSVPALADDALVTLCALDTSKSPSTPQVDRVVLAISEGSTWWAAGSVR